MSLSKNDLANLLRLIGLTRAKEINCEQCLARVAEFAERQLQGRSIDESLEAVEHHLSICSECQEEYQALQRALRNMDR